MMRKILAGLLASAIAVQALAAPATAPFFLALPKHYVAQILNATGTGQVSFGTLGASGTKINSLVCTSTDTSDRVLTFSMVRGGVTYILGSVTIPLGAGTSGTVAPLNVFASTVLGPLDSDQNPYLIFNDASDTFQVASGTTLTSAKIVSCHATGGDF